MLEEKKIEDLLKKLDKCKIGTLERVILANDGTVQSLLSVIFRIPVKIEVIAQLEYSNTIYRWVKLVAKYDTIEQTTALALSIIPIEKNSEEFIKLLRERKLGIGQILSSLGYITEREILGFYSDDAVFARVYRIIGNKENKDVCDLIITEIFSKSLYKTIAQREKNEGRG